MVEDESKDTETGGEDRRHVLQPCVNSLLRQFTPQVEGQLLGSQENQPDKCVQGGIGGLQREIKGMRDREGEHQGQQAGEVEVGGWWGDGIGRDGIQTTSRLFPIPYVTTLATKASVTQ